MTSDAFLLIFLVFLACITFFPAVLKRWGIPGVISLMIVGILAGPNALNLLAHLTDSLHFLGDPDIVYNNFKFFIAALGSLGLVFLMSLAGMEADFKLIDAVKKPVTYLSILTFLLPAVAGFFIYAYFKPDDLPGKLLYASLFASHSVGIVFPVIRELNLGKTKFGASVLISTIVTDVASIILLAVSVQLRKQELPTTNVDPSGLSLFNYIDPQFFGSWFLPLFLLIVLIYMAASIWLVHNLGKWIIDRVDDKDAIITIFLFIIMLTVLIGEMLGINLIVGAFIAGMGLSPLITQRTVGRDVLRKFEGIGYGLLIPFLFISIGMDTDLRVFNSIGNLQILLFTVIGLVSSKILSGLIAMKLSGYSTAKGFCAGLMTVPQLSATLAAAAVGKDLGMLDDHFFNAIVVLSIVTTLPIPSLVRAIIYGKKLTFDPVQEEVYTIPKSINDDLL